MRIEGFQVPPLDNNVYFVMDEGSKEALVVDTALGASELLGRAKEVSATVKLVLNTHGHPDHTADNETVRAATGAKIAIFEVDAHRLLKSPREPRWYLPAPPPPSKADVLLKEGSEIRVGDIQLRTLHTPGHTEGSACFYSREHGVLFSGDTLFSGSSGRTDVAGGSPARMVMSLRRLHELPPDTRVLPGHGPETRIGEETWIADLAYPVV